MAACGSILAVDDDPDFLAGVALLLQEEGYTVFTAPDCDAAWESLSQHGPDVVILDWNLAGADGISLLRRMRSSHEHAHRYTIMVSARSARTDVARGMHEGADDYLAKPFDNDEFLARVEVGFRTHNLERALAAQIRRSTVLEMAGAVAHEIGNPLAAAKLLVQRIGLRIDTPASPDVAKDLAALETQLQRIEDLVRKAQSLTVVHSKPYAGGSQIIDILHSSTPDPPEEA